jgi:hypothetical protein
MPPKTKIKRNAGGAATQAGINFQNRVAAWVATRILCESSAGGIFGLTGIPSLVRCETEQPVDDLLVGTSASSFAFVNVKHSLDLSSTATSTFETVVQQFTRQFLAFRGVQGARPWEKPLDPARDALVLIVSPATAAPVRVHLKSVLSKIRTLLPVQPTTDAPTNKDEARAVNVVETLFRNAYCKETGVDPTDAQIREVLLLMHVEVLGVEPGGDAEREAKSLLSTIVLRDETQTDAAWATLLHVCGQLAENRGGADLAQLQRQLLAAGSTLKVSRSYEPDLAKLQQTTERTEEALSDLATIRVGNKVVQIDRAVTREIERLSSGESILVVGEPGAGKSGTLVHFADRLKSQGQDYVMLAVDRLTAASEGELRQELGLDHNLPDVLENWVGDAPAFLIIDALDGARGGSAARTLRELIARITAAKTRWRVIASIRKFDLRYSAELRTLFKARPSTGDLPEFRDEEFLTISHVNVRQLSDDELREVQTQSPELATLVSRAPDGLRDLLRNPFNLRLLAALLSGGSSVDQLTPIRTQLELLDRYWRYRVIGSDGGGDARELVLQRVCQAMTDARMLRVDLAHVANAASGDALTNLKSAQVLVEWQPSLDQQPNRYVLAFSHHVLFDYAAARLLLRGDPPTLVRTVEQKPELALILHPSFSLHFQHLWTTVGKQVFWNLAFQLVESPGVPQIGKLVGPSAAANLAHAIVDFDPLLVRMRDSDSARQLPADQIFEHVVGSILVASRKRHPLVGPDGEPWTKLMERVSQNLRVASAYSLRSVLTEACESVSDCTPTQLTDLGAASRRLLRFAWATDIRDEWLVARAIECVAKTAASDPQATAELLRRTLEPEHLRDYGFQEMPWLCRQVLRLLPLDPALVEDIYVGVFGFREKSDAPTAMNPSRILRLSGNRRQDYDMARYELATVYPEFLAAEPERATRAVISAVEAHVREERSVHDTDVAASFSFGSVTARILTDYSSIWDGGMSARHEDPLRMLEAFVARCDELGVSTESLSELRKILQVIVERNQAAVVWARLLQLGAKHPATIGKEVEPLASAFPVLTGTDTMHSAGEYLEACFPSLPDADREKIEIAILDIPHSVSQDHRQQGEGIRNQLLGRLPLRALVTSDAKSLLTRMIDEQSVPDNKRPVQFESFSRAFGEVEYLQEQGVAVDSEANKNLRRLEEPAVGFAGKYRNSSPTAEEIEMILPRLRELYEALARADRDGVDPKQADYGAGVLTEACVAMTQNTKLACDAPAGAFVRDVLFTFRNHPSPEPHPKQDAQFDKFPSWGGPAARISAAQGLANLSRTTTCADNELLEAVELFSRDAVPAVRFQVVVRLTNLYHTDPDRLWRIIERTASTDKSRGVLSSLFSHPLSQLAGAHPDQATACVRTVLDRKLPEADEVSGAAIGILTGLYVWQEHVLSGELLSGFIATPGKNPQLLQRAILNLRNLITHGSAETSSAKDTAIRLRALDVFRRIVQSAKTELSALEEARRQTTFDSWPAEDQERARQLVRLLDTTATEYYFGSGAFEAKQQAQQPGQKQLGPPEKKRLFEESRVIADELAQLGFPSIAHNLLQTLESFVTFDPQRVFLTSGQVVRSGVAGGYQFEQMAADLVVRLVERYLAEYRELLQNDEACRKTLVELLDTFVKAGWSNARRLTYRLQEIYR